VTKVVIVSRTRMGETGVCIGGLVRDTAEDVRLLAPDGTHRHPLDSPYHVGQVLDLELRPAAMVEPPHVEDMEVVAVRFVASQSGLGRYLAGRVTPWVGAPSALFGGALAFRPSGSAYLPPAVALDRSVGFWRPDEDLHLDRPAGRYQHMAKGQPAAIKYVGVAEPTERIPAGALVRVSLSRPFAPMNGPLACWLQLSGWYPE